MAIVSAVATSFKQQLLQGVHNFTLLTSTNTVTSVAAATGTAGPNGTATTTYTGTFTNGGNSAYAGLVITAYSSTTGANNGTYLCLASTTTTLVLANPNGVLQSSGTLPLIYLPSPNGNWFMSLYTASATLGASTTAYTATNEVSSSGYVAGGLQLTSTTPVVSGTTACCLFNTATWTGVTFSTAGAIIYNNAYPVSGTGGQPAALILSFGGTFSVTAGTFTVTFPAQTAGVAILGLA